MITLRKLIGDFKELIQFLKDRYWFYYVIEGDEFHPKLNLNFTIIMDGSTRAKEKEYRRIFRDRERAHRLDIVFNGE